MVPGIGPSADLGTLSEQYALASTLLNLHLTFVVLQARMLSYPDAARYRLGVNYQQLPSNKPVSRVYSPYERDGISTLNGNYGGDPDYVRSSLQPVRLTSHHAVTNKELWSGTVVSHRSEVTDQDFEQSRDLWNIICHEDGRKEFLGNVAKSLTNVAAGVMESAIKMFGQVHPDIESGLKETLGRE
ncbi:MAG: hypothetical protein Q9159_000230 [Coniocarpon cinnabarinum]